MLKIKENFFHKHKDLPLGGNLSSALLDLKKNDFAFIYIYCINSANSRVNKVTLIFHRCSSNGRCNKTLIYQFSRLWFAILI